MYVIQLHSNDRGRIVKAENVEFFFFQERELNIILLYVQIDRTVLSDKKTAAARNCITVKFTGTDIKVEVL